jgi:hypothetical protein
MIDKMREKANV